MLNAILTICGYSFGDRHINLEIDQALKESNGRLELIIFTELNTPFDHPQLKSWIEDPEICERVHIYAKKGYFQGNKNSHYLTEEDLPWWKFENVIRLLRGGI